MLSVKIGPADDQLRMKVFSVTHLGLVRKNNEDRFLVKKLGNGSALVAVAHGMGGHVAGERAAEIAVETMNGFDAGSTDVDAHLVELARTANCSIKEASAKDLSLNGMGTTLTAALVAARLAHWVHVGDSRIYVFREGELAAVTEDHTIAGLLLRSGEISAEEARVHPMRKVLMSCLRGADFEMDSGTLELERPATCSCSQQTDSTTGFPNGRSCTFSGERPVSRRN